MPGRWHCRVTRWSHQRTNTKPSVQVHHEGQTARTTCKAQDRDLHWCGGREEKKAILQTNALFASFRRSHLQPSPTQRGCSARLHGPPSQVLLSPQHQPLAPTSPSPARRELCHLRSINGVYSWLPRSATSAKWGENYNNITNEIE